MPRSSSTSLPSRSAAPLALIAVALTVGSASSFQPSSLQKGNRIRAPSQLFEEKSVEETSSLFGDYHEADEDAATINALFGESVPLKKPDASFGESVPLKRPSTSSISEESPFLATVTTTTTAEVEQPQELKAMKQRNLVVAIASVVFAVTSYVWQFTHPITPVQLLADMQSNSAPLTTIGSNGKPTVVDFWAPWCENCKMAAPTLAKLEDEYAGRINFVLVNGDRPEAWPLIERFGVDAIPHVALISAEGDVETALIGPIPKRVLQADLDVLLDNAAITSSDAATKQDLPYKMLDVFVNAPEYRRVKFQAAVDPTTGTSK